MKAEPEEEAQEAARPEGPEAAAVGGAASPASPVSGRRLTGALRTTPPVARSSEGPRRRTTVSLPFSAEEEALSPSGRMEAVPGRRPPASPAARRRPHSGSGIARGGRGPRPGGRRGPPRATRGSPPSPRAPGTGVSPHGAVSPPAATVFGGGLLDPVPGAGGNSNISHSVPLDSDSDSGLEVDELTAAGTNGATDAEAP